MEVKITKGGKTDVTRANNPFTGWFDQQGYFVPKPFHAFLQNSIPVLQKNPEVVKN